MHAVNSIVPEAALLGQSCRKVPRETENRIPQVHRKRSGTFWMSREAPKGSGIGSNFSAKELHFFVEYETEWNQSRLAQFLDKN